MKKVYKYLEYIKISDGVETDRISVYFNSSDCVIVEIFGEYYVKLYNKIKNMSKEQVIDFFAPKHDLNFTQAC